MYAYICVFLKLFLALRVGHIVQVFGNKILRKIYIGV